MSYQFSESFNRAQAAYDAMVPGDDYDCEAFYAIDAVTEALEAALINPDAAAIDALVDKAMEIAEGKPEYHIYNRRYDRDDECNDCREALIKLNRVLDRAITWQCDNWPMSDPEYGNEGASAPLALAHCAHVPMRLRSWFAVDGTLCVACCDCGAVLAGALDRPEALANAPAEWAAAA